MNASGKKNSETKSSVGFLTLAGPALLAVFLFQPLAQAQIAPEASPQTCVLPQMSRLIVEEGAGARVDSSRELPGSPAGRPENEKGIAATRNLEIDRGLQQARAWFEKGARKGYAPAEINLAVALLAGWGGPRNPAQSLYWLQEAAGQHYPVAYFDLGIVYLEGCGVRQDYLQAAHYFELGAREGHAASQMNLGYLYDHGLGVTQDRAIAAAWYRKAADSDEPSAQYNLADLYLRGEGVSQDDSLAFTWFEKSAAQGHAAACIMVGSLYAAGRGRPRDLSAAYQWLTAAKLQGDTRADAKLAAIESQLPAEQIKQAKSRAQSLPRLTRPVGEVALLH